MKKDKIQQWADEQEYRANQYALDAEFFKEQWEESESKLRESESKLREREAEAKYWHKMFHARCKELFAEMDKVEKFKTKFLEMGNDKNAMWLDLQSEIGEHALTKSKLLESEAQVEKYKTMVCNMCLLNQTACAQCVVTEKQKGVD